MASTSMGCVMLYLPSPNGHICSVYEISSYYLHKWSFCLALKARQPWLHPWATTFLEGFLSTLPWILWLLFVCLSTFTLHSIQISGLVQTSHGCPERKVAWRFCFFSFYFFIGAWVCVYVFGFPFFHYLAVIHVVKPTASSVKCLRSTSKQPLPLKFLMWSQ